MMRIIAFALTLIITAAFLGSYTARAADGTSPSHRPQMLFQLSNSEAEAAIAEALASKGAGDKLSATILGRKDAILFSYNEPVTAEIHGLHFDAGTHRWNANILFRSGDEIVSAIPASGRYDEMVEVPVLKREARNDHVISAEDIEIRAFPTMQTRSDTISSPSELIGKSPVRYISAQRPIRASEIASPAVVKKNSLVQLHFTSSGLYIATTGQAMEDGAIGDVINIRNITSKRIVRAVVENEGNVRVITPGSAPSLAGRTAYAPSASPMTGGNHATN